MTFCSNLLGFVTRTTGTVLVLVYHVVALSVIVFTMMILDLMLLLVAILPAAATTARRMTRSNGSSKGCHDKSRRNENCTEWHGELQRRGLFSTIPLSTFCGYRVNPTKPKSLTAPRAKSQESPGMSFAHLCLVFLVLDNLTTTRGVYSCAKLV